MIYIIHGELTDVRCVAQAMLTVKAFDDNTVLNETDKFLNV